MRERLIIFLIRKKLGLKKCQYFQFHNQKSKETFYYFTGNRLMRQKKGKIYAFPDEYINLNRLLSDECKVVTFSNIYTSEE